MEDPCNNINEDPVSRERTKSMSNNRSFDGGGEWRGIMFCLNPGHLYPNNTYRMPVQ